MSAGKVDPIVQIERAVRKLRAEECGSCADDLEKSLAAFTALVAAAREAERHLVMMYPPEYGPDFMRDSLTSALANFPESQS
jgi:hypothetical protein